MHPKVTPCTALQGISCQQAVTTTEGLTIVLTQLSFLTEILKTKSCGSPKISKVAEVLKKKSKVALVLKFKSCGDPKISKVAVVLKFKSCGSPNISKVAEILKRKAKVALVLKFPKLRRS